jgi:hypothetical protein
MSIPFLTRRISCLLLLTLFSLATRAAPLNLPPTAIADDTFIIATLDLTKLDPATLEATAKAALGEKAADADDLLGSFKTHYEKFAGKGAESITAVISGDPDQQKGPKTIFYVRFKQGADHAAVEKQIRDSEGEGNPTPLEIIHEGDFMLIHEKGSEPPQAGSEPRAKRFTDALADSDKPAAVVVIFNDAMIKSVKKDVGHGAPPGVQTLVEDSKSIRMDATLGDAVKGEVVIETADEEAATRMMGAITGLGEFMSAQVTQMKQAFVQAPPQALGQLGPQMATMRELADAAAILAEAFKPQQSGTKITLPADAKVLGAILKTVILSQKMMGEVAPAAKGGL